MEYKLKRKRTPNFTAEEKLKFVRLLREEGHCIISKVTAHDVTSNKEKEQAWTKIAQIHNSCGDMMRTTETLKKLWCKLKSEAKTFKAASKRSVNGTGGGPPTKFGDPVLDLVVEITGRASTGILNMNDCDAVVNNDSMAQNDSPVVHASPSIENIDESLFLEGFEEEKFMAIQVEEVEKEAQEATVVEHEEILKDNKKYLKGKECGKRRRPEVDVGNERSSKMKTQQRITNRFAAERLRAEQAKTNLIMQQTKQNAELHSIKMYNENLKKELLQTLLKKVLDADTKDVTKVAAQFAFE